jgi:hypothetical protein
MVSVHVSAGFKENALARLVVEPFPTQDALHHVIQRVSCALQRLSHTPKPRVALLELGLVRL